MAVVWHEDLRAWVEQAPRWRRHLDPRLAFLELPGGLKPSRRAERLFRSMPLIADISDGWTFQREGVLNQWVFAVLAGSVAVTVGDTPVTVVTRGAWLAESLHPTITVTALTAAAPLTVAVFELRRINTANAMIPGLEDALLREGRFGPPVESPAAARYGWR